MTRAIRQGASERMARVLVQGPDIRRSNHGGVVTFVKILLSSRLSQEYQMDWDFLEVRGKTPIHAVYYFCCDVFRVHRNLKRNEYDLVHAHLSIAPSSFVKVFFYVFEKRLRGFRFVLHFHGGKFESIKLWFPLFRVALKRAEKILFLSEHQARGFRCRHLVDRIEVVPNFVPDSPQDLDQRDPHRMLFIGRITEEKGVFDLIRAVALMARNLDGFTLYICGDGPALGKARSLVETLGLQKLISFEGYVDDVRKHALMSRCSLLVLPSWSEGFPFAVIEAMSRGMAVVSTRVGALDEVLEDGTNGRFVELRNPEQLSQVLTELLSRPLLLKQYGDKNRAEFVERYVMDPIGVETFSRIYGVAIQRSSSCLP